MPANSLIVGVDLAPIKPIPRAITFQSDITTDQCRATIRQHLKTWKADTVLHDGAPNVGVAWVQDAFSQAELALQALKLATDFLIEGGTFVTKVFRSKDYNALLWVFNQLFAKVEATKPPSSRNVSAEIFVVCRGFKAPKRIDPKFLDPRSVFAELSDPAPNNEAKVFNPEKKKRKRDGYEEGDYIQFRETAASQFIETLDPIAILGSLSKLSFEQPPETDPILAILAKLPETTKEVKDCCQDLKVLGRKEFRLLLRWRLRAREALGLTLKKKPDNDPDEEVAEVAPMDEELRIQEEMQRINEKENSRRKRERRRENERKQKEVVRMQLHMITPKEIGLEQAGPNGEDSMFALAAVDRAGAIERVSKGQMAVELAQLDEELIDLEHESDMEEDRLDRDLDELYSQYQERKSASDAKHQAKKLRREHGDGDWEGFSDIIEDASERFEAGSDDSWDEDVEGVGKTRLMLKNSEKSMATSEGLTRRASTFFQQDIFKDIEDFVSEDVGHSAVPMDRGDDVPEADSPMPKKSSPTETTKDDTSNKGSISIMSSQSGLLANSQPRKLASSDAQLQHIDLNNDKERGFEVVPDSEPELWDREVRVKKDRYQGKCIWWGDANVD